VNKSLYRADIDGLRAIAILPVLLFHAKLPFVTGGFVGVDVFFAISGYLITSILLKEVEANTFNYLQFFTRRIRRLFPVLLVVYLVTLLVFVNYYPPFLFDSIAQSALASIFLSSNMFFWQEGGYFSKALELNPLLHTWSLSVEEQFYLVFPTFLIVIFKYIKAEKNRLFLLLGLIILSLLLAIYMAPPRGSYASFYLLPTRAYELGLGAMLAYITHLNIDSRIRDMRGIREIGLLLIVLPIFLYDEFTPFPSYYALAPVFGACLMILARNTQGLTYKIITSKLIVFIGLISYSLYLWHWPIIVFNNWYFSNSDELYRGMISLLISVAVAILSYRYIETPFRNKQKYSGKLIRKIFMVSVPALIGLCMVALFYGNQFIVDPSGETHKGYTKAIQAEPTRKSCTDNARNMQSFGVCSLTTAKNIQTDNSVFIWGDSHASAMIPAFEEIAKNRLVNFAVTTGCPPVLNIQRTDFSQKCRSVNNKVYEHITEKGYRTIFMVAAFNNYVNKGIVGQENAQHSRDPGKAKAALKIELHSTIDNLQSKGFNVVIVLQPPVFDKDVPLDYFRQSIIDNKFSAQTIELNQYGSQKESFLSIIPDNIKNSVIDVTDLFCTEAQCFSAFEDGLLLYKDKHHISNYQAREIGKVFSLYLNNNKL
jgi:peptidoglycan/LPS O-acetylase OafA/YrhL